MFNRTGFILLIGLVTIFGYFFLHDASSKNKTIDILPGSYKYDDNQKNDFSPNPLSVNVGTKITWINKDPATPHSVRTDGGKVFQSPMLKSDQQYTFIFVNRGIYSYHCDLHPWMKGYIEVK